VVEWRSLNVAVHIFVRHISFDVVLVTNHHLKRCVVVVVELVLEAHIAAAKKFLKKPFYIINSTVACCLCVRPLFSVHRH
jgi:hypothetical protein